MEMVDDAYDETGMENRQRALREDGGEDRWGMIDDWCLGVTTPHQKREEGEGDECFGQGDDVRRGDLFVRGGVCMDRD